MTIYKILISCYYNKIMEDRILAPSLLSADFSDLSGAVKKINSSHAGALHFDVMDGAFVPEISVGQVVLRSIRPLSALPFDVHLMTENPARQIESFSECGADWITFHYESVLSDSAALLKKIRSLGKKAGISLKPKTSVEEVQDLLEFADIILIMTVEPGFGGQTLIGECLEKVSRLVEIREKLGLNYKISVDGGVNGQTLDEVLKSGVDIVVSGSAFFKGTLNWRN